MHVCNSQTTTTTTKFLVQNLNYNVSSKTLCLWKTNFTEFFWGQSTLMTYLLPHDRANDAPCLTTYRGRATG